MRVAGADKALEPNSSSVFRTPGYVRWVLEPEGNGGVGAANDTEEGVRSRCGGLFDPVPKLGLCPTGGSYPEVWSVKMQSLWSSAHHPIRISGGGPRNLFSYPAGDSSVGSGLGTPAVAHGMGIEGLQGAMGCGDGSGVRHRLRPLALTPSTLALTSSSSCLMGPACLQPTRRADTWSKQQSHPHSLNCRRVHSPALSSSSATFFPFTVQMF